MRRILLTLVIVCATQLTQAQLPNLKFGKPSQMEWDFNAWGEAPEAEAVVLCKTMELTYQLSRNFNATSNAYTELSTNSLQGLGGNSLDYSGTRATYVCKLRTKILKEEGRRYANIDIVYYCDVENEYQYYDEIESLKVKIFRKNEKGKVEKISLKNSAITDERLDDHYKVKHIKVEEAQAGDIIEYQYEITSNRITYLYDWSFQEEIPVICSKCDLDIPAFLTFNINAPIHPLIKKKVEQGTVHLQSHTGDMQADKTYPTNHYLVTGEYILPKGLDLQRKENETEAARVSSNPGKISSLIGTINNRNVSAPAAMPKGVSHLMVGK